MVTWDIENRKHRRSSASSFTVTQKVSHGDVAKLHYIFSYLAAAFDFGLDQHVRRWPAI
jgi:hypothetical protein